MKKFEVTITETLKKTVEVEAETQEEGLEPHIERRPDHSGRHVLHDVYPRGA